MTRFSSGAPGARFSALVAAYSIAAGVVGLLSAPFIDRFDRRTLLLYAYAGFTVATLLCGLASNAHTLLIARAIGGRIHGTRQYRTRRSDGGPVQTQADHP